MEQVFALNNIRLIVGLGNVGNDYVHTRHNAGFIFVDSLARTWDPRINWNSGPDKVADLASFSFPDREAMRLAKPTTMMNLSGRAVVSLMNYYKLTPDQIVIAHDDLDLELGEAKLHFAKGPKAHNGISSIEQFVGTKEFWRLRLGVDNREIKGNSGIPGERYALERFKTAELETLQTVIDGAIAANFSLIKGV